MKNLTLSIVLACYCMAAWSQITFDPGYFIDNDNNRTECLIRNVDWHNNPDQIRYKLSDDSDDLTLAISDLQEFGINNGAAFERHTVDIDLASDDENKLSYKRSPEFEQRTLLLKVLVKGKYNLYEYRGKEVTRFFYKKEDNDVTQLIYKRYNHDDSHIGTNDTYKQQLVLLSQDSEIGPRSYTNTSYREKDLISVFNKMNGIKESKDSKKQKVNFNLSIRPGISLSSLKITEYYAQGGVRGEYNFADQVNMRFGIEAELMLPFNKNKWSVTFEPTYQSYKVDESHSYNIYKVDYKTIDLPIGIRYYMYLGDKSKLFVNANYSAMDISFDTNEIIYKRSNRGVKEAPSLSVGVGYAYNKKLHCELRYHLPKNIMNNYFYQDSSYKMTSFIIGYTLF